MSFRRWLLLSSLLILAILSITGYIVWSEYFSARPFESQVWKQGDERVRGRMVDDVRSMQLLGMTETDVVDVLGDPDYRLENEAHYLFDQHARIFSWTEILVVKFDPENQTVEDSYVTD